MVGINIKICCWSFIYVITHPHSQRLYLLRNNLIRIMIMVQEMIIIIKSPKLTLYPNPGKYT